MVNIRAGMFYNKINIERWSVACSEHEIDNGEHHTEDEEDIAQYWLAGV